MQYLQLSLEDEAFWNLDEDALQLPPEHENLEKKKGQNNILRLFARTLARQANYGVTSR